MRRILVPARRVWMCATLAVVVSGLCAGPVHAELSNADKRTLVELALRWAVEGGIPDVKLMSDPSKLVVVSHNLPLRTELRVPERTVVVQSPVLIQTLADVHGDFLYFRVGPFSGEKGHATVPIALVWATGVQSKTPHLSGGGATLQFEQREGKWTLLPASEHWAS